MSEILISYRREDSPDVTGRIYDRLVQEFGKDWVFKDVDSIPFGVDFRTHLDEQVAKCHVFLAVMGPDWMRKSGKGKSSLDDTEDFIRFEIESALRRGIPVIPLFVRGMSMPKADRLPPSMEGFAYRNGLNIRADPDFHRDMDRLIEDLRKNIEVLKAPHGWIGVVIEEPHPSYPNFWILAEKRVGVIIEDIIKEGPSMNDHHRQLLNLQLSYDEIKQAMWSIPDNKALGLDGYNSGFYKAA